MTLRSRVLIAQLPLALALAVVGTLAVITLSSVGQSGQRILQDNYRSVLAAQRMKDALERMDSAALFLVLGERDRALVQVATYRSTFERELKMQETNITEAGEGGATQKLRQLWNVYQRDLDRVLQLEDSSELRRRYLEVLNPSFMATKDAADQILALNQDAMVRKSEALRRFSQQVNTLTILGVLGALIAGAFASANLTTRALRPIRVLGQAVQRLGEGDLAARARVEGAGEISQLASDFNAMAESLMAYRQSSLGELLQAQQASQAAIDSLPDPVVVFALDGSILNVNQAAEAVLGIHGGGGSDPLAPVPPELRAVLDRVRVHVLGGKGAYLPHGYEEAVRVEAAEGPRFLLPRGSPVYGESAGLMGATVLLQDVTRLRRFDELKNDLVATVAHEFRTPLTSLRMAIHLSAEGVAGPLTEKQADLLQAAREDCERLQTIVDDLLDLSRIQAGRLELQVRPVRVEELLESARSVQAQLAEEKAVRLVLAVAPGVDTVEVDPERIGLVLNNLLSNAVRHTPRSGQVDVQARRENGRLKIEVSDSGPGIPLEYQARIFEKFYRVPGAASGGAGLGLSIARDVVEAHGGEIGLVSAPGQGSRFWFTVPLSSQQGPPAPT